jgi:hypothetical protein
VLRPAGRCVLLEHVRSTRPVIRAAERLLDPLARAVRRRPPRPRAARAPRRRGVRDRGAGALEPRHRRARRGAQASLRRIAAGRRADQPAQRAGRSATSDAHGSASQPPRVGGRTSSIERLCHPLVFALGDKRVHAGRAGGQCLGLSSGRTRRPAIVLARNSSGDSLVNGYGTVVDEAVRPEGRPPRPVMHLQKA